MSDETDIPSIVEVVEADTPKPAFKYTEMAKAPYEHRQVALMYAMGRDTEMVAAATGYTHDTILKILNHPPVQEAIEIHIKTLKVETDLVLVDWMNLLPKAIEGVDKALSSDNERVRMAASFNYLDRHPSSMFTKKASADTTKSNRIMDSEGIKELKQSALNLRGENDVEQIAEQTERPDPGSGEDPGAGIDDGN